MEASILGLVYHAHAPTAERFDDPVMRDTEHFDTDFLTTWNRRASIKHRANAAKSRSYCALSQVRRGTHP
jgi:hypothetical protein